MLEDGLSYPFRDEWIGRIVIGGILGFLSILIIPSFIISGYTLDVIRQTVRGEDEPPEWGDWVKLTIDGVKVAIVGIVYTIIPFIVFIGIGLLFLGLGAASSGGGGLLAGLGILLFVLFIPIMLIVYYFLPAALGNMAVEDSLGAAFDVGVIKNVALTSDYLAAVLLPILVGVILAVIYLFLAITIVGLLLVPFVVFYGQVAIFRMFGIAFARVSDEGTR